MEKSLKRKFLNDLTQCKSVILGYKVNTSPVPENLSTCSCVIDDSALWFYLCLVGRFWGWWMGIKVIVCVWKLKLHYYDFDSQKQRNSPHITYLKKVWVWFHTLSIPTPYHSVQFYQAPVFYAASYFFIKVSIHWKVYSMSRDSHY